MDAESMATWMVWAYGLFWIAVVAGAIVLVRHAIRSERITADRNAH